jgi:general secretion pathway protein K
MVRAALNRRARATRPRAPAGRRGARGAAIVIAMLLAALSAAVVVALASGQQRWVEGVAARRDQAQAQSLALAGVQWTRAILFEDQAQGGQGDAAVDWLGEPWALPLPPTPLEHGSIEGRIVDAQAFFNVNNVRLPGTQGDAARATLARLFALRGVAPSEVDALAAYVDAPVDGRRFDDPDAWYRRQPTPYLRAAAPMLRVAELAAVQGFDDASLSRVQRDLAALPADGTPINVNTAAPDVLAAALDTTPERLAGFIAERARRPVTSIATLRERLPEGVAVSDERVFGWSSTYFVVTVRARQGDTVAQARALLARHPRSWPTVVWQTVE